MKQVIKNYSFNATGKTVTLSDFSTVLLERLQLIVDSTTNNILYNFADPSVATASVSGNVITLSTIGSAAGTDKLQVIYDCASTDPVYDVQPISAASLPLPAGAATSGNQTTANASLSSIDGKLPAQVSGRVPVDGSGVTQPTKQATAEQALLSAAALNADLVPSTDVSGYKSFSLQLTGTWVGTLSFLGSNDNVNFISVGVQIMNQQLASSLVTTAGTNNIYIGAINFRYLKVSMTAYTSGTANGTLEVFAHPSTYAMAAQNSIITQRSISRQTLQASAAKTASNTSATFTGAGAFSEAIVTLNCTAASGTSPTLSVVIQVSDDGGTTWYNHPSGTFTQLTAAGTQALALATFGDTIRVSATIGGTSPSFTYAVKAVFK